MGAWDWVSSEGDPKTARRDLAPHKTENGSNWYQDQWGGWRVDTGTHYETNPALGTTESGGGGEEGGFEFPTDLFSTQNTQSGLPAWGNDWAKGFLDKYSSQVGGGLSNAFAALENPVALNEAEKQNLQYFTQQNLNPIISKLGYNGVLNSTTAQDSITKLLADMGAKSYDESQKNQQAKIAAYQKSQALLTAILEAARQSSGSASDPLEPWKAMLPYLLGSATA